MFKKLIKNIALWLLDISGYKVKEQNKQENKKENEEKKEFTKISIKNIKFLKKKIFSIPKQIFFINLGHIKNYMTFCMDSFKDLNPDFKIDLLNYETVDDLYRDKNVQNILNFNKDVDKNNIKSILNMLKYRIVYQYGGLYSDLHNYCIMPLRDMLQYDNVITSVIKDGSIFQYDYMFGVIKGYEKKIQNVFYPPIYLDTIDYQSMKLSFYRCQLKHSMFRLNNKSLQSIIMNFEN